MPASPPKTSVRYSAETWEAVRSRAIAGATFPELHRLYGIHPQVIGNKSRREDWPTPKRLSMRKKEMEERGGGVEAAPAKGNPPQPPALDGDNLSTTYESRITNHDKNVVSHAHQALLDFAAAPPADFQKALAAYAQAAIAEGVVDIPAPRSSKELATMVGIWGKASGLDAKQGHGGNAPLVNPLRTVSRRAGPVVEASPVPDTPEPGSAEFEAWEV